MKTYQIFIIIVLLRSSALAQSVPPTCNCCTSNYKQFDFWLGDWDVFNRQGIKVGENTILVLQDSCVIQENWVSQGQTGTSYNYFNKVDSTWNQLYIDNRGSILQLKGTFRNKQMILKSEKIKSAGDNFYYFNQITWSKEASGYVTQKWDLIDESGNIMQTIFDGIYRPKIK